MTLQRFLPSILLGILYALAFLTSPGTLLRTWERVASSFSAKTTVSLKCFGFPSTFEICCFVSYTRNTMLTFIIVNTLNNYWMRSSRIWRIIKAEVCVICRSRRLRQITQTEALIIPYILRESNSIIVLLFICICEPFPWRSHLYFEFWHKQHKLFVFWIWYKQHKLVWRHKVV